MGDILNKQVKGGLEEYADEKLFKDLPLVVVITATAYGQPYAHPQVTKMLFEYILPAVIK